MSETAALARVRTPEGIRAAREAFLVWLSGGGEAGRAFLQLRIHASDDGYELRHREDAGLSPDRLETLSDPHAARDLARTTSEGLHRPLRTAPNLRTGWRLVRLDAPGLFVALDYFYPAAVAHWHAERAGTLRVTDWPETAARQSGIYSVVALLSDRAVRDTVRACCDDSVCLRRVSWRVDAGAPPQPAGGEREEGSVPCPEACSLFISLARKVLSLERQPTTRYPGLGELTEEEVEQLAEIAAVAAAGALQSVREGDFESGANRRRIRYLAARLEAHSAADAGDASRP